MSKFSDAIDGLKEVLVFSDMEKARIVKYVSRKPDGKGGWKYTYAKDTKGKEKKIEEKGKKDSLNEKTLKQNIKIVEQKNWNTKRIYNGKYELIEYDFVPKEIEFKSPAVNDMNQNLCGGFSVKIDGKFIDDFDATTSRIQEGLKPMGIVHFRDGDDSRIKKVLEFMDSDKFDVQVDDNPFIEGLTDVKIARRGKLKDLFDLKTLKKDYEKANINIDIKSVENKYLRDYFDDWDHQDEDSSVDPWETGLILGYPIENTISLYRGGIG